MKRNLLVTILVFIHHCLFVSFNVNAQKFSITNKLGNKLYYRVSNQILVVAENHSCSQVRLYSNDARIERHGAGEFDIIPLKIGGIKVDIFIKQRHDSTYIGSHTFLAKSIPHPRAMISNTEEDTISLNTFLTKDLLFFGMIEGFENYNGIKGSIVSFKISHLRGDSTMRIFQMRSMRFDDGFIKYREKAFKKGDKVLFFDIIGKGLSGQTHLAPLELYIN
jgi:hypothetical protein